MAPDSSIDLKSVRSELELSQSQLADMIGVSMRTVQSCEQGWRNPSPALEKAVILLLLSKSHGAELGTKCCWESINCSENERNNCLVYQTKQGHLCWLLSGHICRGRRLRTWTDKKDVCMQCQFFLELLPEGIPVLEETVSS